MQASFEAIEELEPGDKWAALFARHWPRYESWFLQEGEAARTSYAESLRALREHMPELVPTYQRLCQLADAGDLEARFLAMWAPPSYLSGCSQERRAAINSRTLAGARVAYKALTAPLEPVNEGSFRALKVIIPEGNIMMARFPAPMSTCWCRSCTKRRRVARRRPSG